MKRTASLPTRQVRNLAHKALKALGFINTGLLSRAPHPAPAAPVAPTALEAQEHTGGFAAPDPAGQAEACRLQIPFEDWDILFRSVQSRLGRAAGVRLAPGPSPQADDACAHLQAVVLDCVAALEQLRSAVTPEHA